MTVATSLHSASQQSIDRVFRALANPTRRRAVERLNRSPASVSEPAQPFDMACPPWSSISGFWKAGSGLNNRSALRQFCRS